MGLGFVVFVVLLSMLSTVVCRNETRNNINDLLDVWDPYRLIDAWPNRAGVNVTTGISEKCEDDIGQYLTALDQGRNWAVKLVDASGRYSSGLFSGNAFWLGSNAVCSDLNDDVTAPFHVGFYVAVLSVDITALEIKGHHVVTLGLCLPRACTAADVRAALRYSTDQQLQLERTIAVRYVRFLSQMYSYFSDPKFFVMLCATALTFSLMLGASLYDIRRKGRWRHKQRVLKEELANNNNGMPEKWSKDSEVYRLASEIRGGHFLAVSEGERDIHPSILVDQNLNPAELQYLKNDKNNILQEEVEVEGNTSEQNIPQPESYVLRVLLSFSVPANLRKICSLEAGDDTLCAVHGLRFFSLLWVIFVHNCLVLFQLSDNKSFRAKAEEDFLYQTVSNGAYSVDTFFFISGLLISFIFLRSATNHNLREKLEVGGMFSQLSHFINMVVYRFFRLTPPYLYVIGLTEVSMKWFHDHAVMELPTLDDVNCPKYWWRNILYVNTLFPASERCMGWTWYLSNDTQFYIIGAIILIIGVKRLWFGVTAIGALLVAAWCTTAYITVATGHVPSIKDPFAQYEELYDKPWTRIGPYLVGMCTGWLLLKTKCRINMNKTVVVIGWTASMVVMSSLVYGLYLVQLTTATSAAYVSLGHTGWALCVAWVLIACCTGHGGYVNTILSWKYIYPLSRLTYCAYLIHPVLMRSAVLGSDSSVHITRDFVMVIFCGYVVASYSIALVLSLAFEAPVVSWLRLARPLKRDPSTK